MGEILDYRLTNGIQKVRAERRERASVRAGGTPITGQLESILDLLDARVIGLRARNIEEQILDQLGGGILGGRGLALLDQSLGLAVDPGQQVLDRDTELDGANLGSRDQPASSQESSLDRRRAGRFGDPGDDGVDLTQAALDIRPPQHIQESQVVTVTDFASLGPQIGIGLAPLAGSGQPPVELCAEQGELRQKRGFPNRAQLVHQRQQRQCGVGHASLDLLQVVWKLDQGEHEGLGRFRGSGQMTRLHRPRDLLHLLGEHRSAIHLGDLKDAVDLM